jgi:large subunit ribosomal protein L21
VYAVIRTGGKQYKVKVGDVIDVERVSGDGDNVELVPLLVVDDDGNVSSRPSELVGAKVTASVLDQHRGDKLRVFTYKNKTGQRRHQGHRQSLTTIRVEGIEPPGGAKAATRAKTTTRAGADAKAKPARTATKAEATPAKAKATPAKATEAKATQSKAKEAGSKAKAAEAKEGTAKAKPARTAAKAGAKAEAAETKAKAGGSKDGESKPAGRGGRTRAKQDEES